MEEFWNNLFNVNLIESNDNVETYEANMKIIFKQIKSKNEKEALFYKQKLLNKKENMKIYNIIYDKISNIILCSYDPLEKEKMNSIINHNKNEEEKEATLEGHCEPLCVEQLCNNKLSDVDKIFPFEKHKSFPSGYCNTKASCFS